MEYDMVGFPKKEVVKALTKSSWKMMKYSHRIIEWARLEETSRITKMQPHCPRHGCQPLGQVQDQIAHHPFQCNIRSHRQIPGNKWIT